MTRIRRGGRTAQPRNRTIPPLPHPSWVFGSDYDRQTGDRLEPDDFWRRLGI